MSQKQAYEILLASAILQDKDPVNFINLKIQEETVGEGYQPLFSYLKRFVSEYGKIPEVATVKETFDFKFIKVKETTTYYKDVMVDNYKKKAIYTLCKTANDMSKAGEHNKAMELISNKVAELNILNNQGDIIEFSQNGLELFTDYQTKQLLGGDDDYIKLGWPTFDKQNGGLTGGDVLSIVGRPGTGKTYLSLFIALYAWKTQGKIPLFVSMEVKPEALIHRIIAMYTSTYVSDIKKGTISTKKKNEIMTSLEGLGDLPKLWVIDGNLSSTVSDIENWVTELKPDLVVVDGAYLIEQEGKYSKSFHEKIKDSCEGMKKRVASLKNIPVVLSYQFNRDAAKLKPDEKASLEHIGGSDAIGQISSIVIGLFQGDEKGNTIKKKVISILKGREGEQGDFDIHWKFHNYPSMCFDEITEAEYTDEMNEEMDNI